VKLAIPSWEIPTLAISGSTDRFPVRRVFCMGLNYLDHKREMGISGDVPPFMFAKAVTHAVPCEPGAITDIKYPSKTTDYQWECELTAVIGKRGANIPAARANEHIWGYAVGLDMTRRDLQVWAKQNALPWDIGKDVEQSGPVGAITPASIMGHPTAAKSAVEVGSRSRHGRLTWGAHASPRRARDRWAQTPRPRASSQTRARRSMDLAISERKLRPVTRKETNSRRLGFSQRTSSRLRASRG